MKTRPLLILILFAVSAVILVWIYFTATRGRTRNRENPWHETIEALDACCQRKHHKAARYDRFAEVAAAESDPDAARLFRAMALSDRLQEHNCAAIIVHLGGEYAPPAPATFATEGTDGNLARSIRGEQHWLDGSHGRWIGHALDKGNRYAARALIWSAANDLQHLLLMERCREARIAAAVHAATAAHATTAAATGRARTRAAGFSNAVGPGATSLKAASPGATPLKIASPDATPPEAAVPEAVFYLICPVCGNTYDSKYSDNYCPFCLTNRDRFIRIE